MAENITKMKKELVEQTNELLLVLMEMQEHGKMMLENIEIHTEKMIKGFSHLNALIDNLKVNIEPTIQLDISVVDEHLTKYIASGIENVNWEGVGAKIGSELSQMTWNISMNMVSEEKESEETFTDKIYSFFESEIMKEIGKMIIECFGALPLITFISAALKSLFGSSAAKSALTFMITPFLKVVLPILGVVLSIKLIGKLIEWWKSGELNRWWEEYIQPWFAKEKWLELGDNLLQGLSEKWNEFVEWWKDTGLYSWWKKDVAPWFTKEKWQELGAGFLQGLSEKWDEFVKWWKTTGVYNWWEENVAPWFAKEKWQEFGDNFLQGLSEKWDEFVEWWKTTGVYNWWEENVAPWFTKEKWQELGDNSFGGLSEKWDEFVEWWKTTGVYNWWEENVVPWFAKEKWQEVTDGIKSGIVNKWKEIESWWLEKGDLSKISVEIGDFLQGVKDAWAKLEKWWNENKLSLDTIKLGVKVPEIKISYDAKHVLASLFQLFGFPGTPIFSLTYPKYASGGFPEDGWFRASHGEIMGRFDNGKSVVANNMQITQGIANAVYPAVYDAMTAALAHGNNGGGDIVVRIGEKEVFRAVRREANNYTRQTGKAAFIY